MFAASSRSGSAERDDLLARSRTAEGCLSSEPMDPPLRHHNAKVAAERHPEKRYPIPGTEWMYVGFSASGSIFRRSR